MTLHFKTPVLVEDGHFLIAADAELILRNWEATPEEMDAIVRCINGYAAAVELLKVLRNSLDQYDDGDWFLHEGGEDVVGKVDDFLEKLK